MPLTLAASAAGIAFQSLCCYRNQHPAFRDALESAVARGVEARLEVIEKASKAGDWRAASWWLEHVLPENFGKTRVQVEAIGQLEHSFVIPAKTLDEIAEARKRHEQRQLTETNAA